MKLPLLALTAAAAAFGVNTALPVAVEAAASLSHLLTRVSELTTYFT